MIASGNFSGGAGPIEYETGPDRGELRLSTIPARRPSTDPRTRCATGLASAIRRWRAPRATVGSPTALALVLCLLALTPAAWACLPDPLWVAGTYDGADQDEANALLTVLSAIVEPHQTADRVPAIARGCVLIDASDVPDVGVSLQHGRSPPVPPSLPS